MGHPFRPNHRIAEVVNSVLEGPHHVATDEPITTDKVRGVKVQVELHSQLASSRRNSVRNEVPNTHSVIIHTDE